MTNRIRILPSEREFVSRGNSTLLEAGLGAGLALGYGCSNGNCGECLARVVSGKVRKIRHHDYVTNKGHANNQILMCCNTAVSDVVLEAVEAQSSSEIPQQRITARVKNIQLTDNDVALVHLKTPRSQRLRFLAGQHIQIGLKDKLSATHSIASCPCDDMNLHFNIPLLTDDPFSSYVFNRMKKGNAVEIEGPNGNFVLDELSTRPLVFIAWRTGFGPIRSLVEHAMALDMTQAIDLVWIAKNPRDRYLDNLCRSWGDALSGFKYTPVDATQKSAPKEIVRWLADQLKQAPGKLVESDFYIAGNEEILGSCRSYLSSQKVPAGQLVLNSLIHE
jgi:CDP-4-dehydro-6-deoxyglucose reductase